MSERETAKQRRENEIEFSRIVAFSDGVFAIAITLLVLNLGIESGVPGDRLWHEVWELHEDFIAFAISFAVIGRFWILHHRFFGQVEAFDSRLIRLNILYLGTIVLIPFSSQLLGEYGGEAAAVVVYAVNLAACVVVGFWMNAYAHNAGLTTIDTATHQENRNPSDLHLRRLPGGDPTRLRRAELRAAAVAGAVLRPLAPARRALDELAFRGRFPMRLRICVSAVVAIALVSAPAAAAVRATADEDGAGSPSGPSALPIRAPGHGSCTERPHSDPG